MLFYATDDDGAATAVERLIRSAGFEPFKVGGAAAAVRIEMPGGDLHQYGLNGELLDLDRARAAIDPKEVPARCPRSPVGGQCGARPRSWVTESWFDL